MEENKKNYELIIVIVNQGYTGDVMDAAKECGARGGTTFVAHGTGNKELGTFFGIVIQPEKEIVFINQFVCSFKLWNHSRSRLRYFIYLGRQ